MPARRAMVAALAAAGAAADPAVLAAMGQVPREAFVPRFWSLPPQLRTGTPAEVREWRVDGPETTGDAIALVYDIDRALAIRRAADPDGPTAGAGVTSTASAPRVVAAMLELLDLAPGMRVLEIGTGSGYNAALLRELVGPDGSVASVDIDAHLVAEAGERLGGAGYPDVHLAALDGYLGLAERAPFDRVVATVGCLDVAPAWLDQLAPGGFALLPLRHGGSHPLTRIERSAGEITGVVVGGAVFVAIQGHQAGRSPWPFSGRIGPRPDVAWAALPPGLAAALRPEPGRAGPAAPPLGGLAYLLGLQDHRAAGRLDLVEAGSSAAIEPGEGRIGWAGSGGPALRDRLVELCACWVALGHPAAGAFASRFAPIAPRARPAVRLGPGPADWRIDRVDFCQTVRLDARG